MADSNGRPPIVPDLIVGIDLGTTNSLVGVVDSGFPILLADENHARLTPSAVFFPPDNEARPVIGEAALRARATNPARAVTSIKRLMGMRAAEVDPDTFPYPVAGDENGRTVVTIEGREPQSPEAISALILGHLKRIAETALEEPVSRAVITVPAYFNDAQRNATKQAGELAGLKVERIVNEPTAAALAYGLDKLSDHARVAVFDFGGGTFDISILEMRDGVFQVISTNGDTHLGGDDIDQSLGDWIAREENLQVNSSMQSTQLTAAARAAKEALSSEDETVIRLPFFDGTRSIERTVTRDDLNRIAKPIIERTRAHCLRALADAEITDPAAQLDEIILVGGSTRMPLVREIVEGIFHKLPNTSQNPDEAVALGAAIQAGILCGRIRNVVLLDVTPLSLGIETFGGLMNVIIGRNSTIPCKAGELFTNAVANQESMMIRILQGEREMARDNWELGHLTLDFEPGPKGSARVGVQFEIDENGILKVLARDTKTHTDRVLEITDAAVDVDDEQVEAMIAESIDHAFDDMNERIWTEAKMKSEELLPAVEQALQSMADVLPEDDLAAIQTAADGVRAALDSPGKDATRLKQANHALDDATQHLAALLVERAMDQAFEDSQP